MGSAATSGYAAGAAAERQQQQQRAGGAELSRLLLEAADKFLSKPPNSLPGTLLACCTPCSGDAARGIV